MIEVTLPPDKAEFVYRRLQEIQHGWITGFEDRDLVREWLDEALDAFETTEGTTPSLTSPTSEIKISDYQVSAGSSEYAYIPIDMSCGRGAALEATARRLNELFPEILPKPRIGFTIGAGKYVFSAVCGNCRGKGKVANFTAGIITPCSTCNGEGMTLTDYGRMLKRFIQEWVLDA